MSTTERKSFWHRHWKLILNVVTISALLIFVYLIKDQIFETLTTLKNVNLWFLLLIIPIEFLNYHGQTKLYQRLFSVVGNRISYRYLFRTCLELNYVNNVFPSGGVSGISYFTLRLKDGDRISASKATLVHLMKLVLTIVSFEILLIAGLVILAASGKASNMTILVTGSLTTLLVIASFLFAYIIGSKERINGFFTALTRGLNKFIQVFRPKNPETIDIARARVAFDDMHENYLLFRRHLHELRVPLVWAIILNLTELLALYAVYAAFGEYVNFGAVILAYGVANIAGFISVLPGGIGIYEVFMTTTLAAAGVPLSLSLPVTIASRIINSTIQLPPGAYFYHKTLHSAPSVNSEVIPDAGNRSQ